DRRVDVRAPDAPADVAIGPAVERGGAARVFDLRGVGRHRRDGRRPDPDELMRLVLFDIDGTLLRSDGAGRRAMEGALIEVFGTSGSADYRYDGKTDQQIVRELMRAHGHADEHIDARIGTVFDLYLGRLRSEE